MAKKVTKESIVETVKAYVAGNHLAVEELPQLITVVHDALSELERLANRIRARTGSRLPRPPFASR